MLSFDLSNDFFFSEFPQIKKQLFCNIDNNKKFYFSTESVY